MMTINQTKIIEFVIFDYPKLNFFLFLFFLIKDKVKLSGNGIDFRALKAGQDIEFEFDPDAGEDNYNWDDERDEPIDYEKIFHHRNMDMIYGANERDEENEDCANGDVKKSADTPFETLKKKMLDISPEPGTGMVTKRVLEPGCGLIIPVGSRVRSELSISVCIL